MSSPLSNLDELVLKCRDEKAKSYIRESVSCYKSGAFRSAIVSTWIAVAFDLIDKIKDLSLTGDKEAEAQLAIFEKARQAGDISKSLTFERELLKIAKDKLELISHIEFIDLDRLQQDRNRCAHPSMTSDGEIFNPSAELARLHIRSAVEYLLQFPPAQGKSALESLVNEVNSEYFPLDLDKAIIAFKSSPLLNGRNSLIKNFIIILLKKVINEQLPPKAQTRIYTALNAIEKMHKIIYDKTLDEKLSNLLKTIDDSKLFKIFPIFKKLSDSWFFIDDSLKQKVEAYVESLPKQYLGWLEFLLSHSGLNTSAKKRLNSATRYELMEPDFEKLPHRVKIKVVNFYVESGSFEQANNFASMIMKHADEFTKIEVEKLIRACGKNHEIAGSFQMGSVISSLRKNSHVSIKEVNEWLDDVGLKAFVKPISEVKNV